MNPRSSFAASDTTYHSFHDIELQEPPSPPRTRKFVDSEYTTTNTNQYSYQEAPYPSAVKMQRQDSGYESHQSGSARNSLSQSRPRRMSNGSSAAVALTSTRTRTRPSTRRSAKSYPQTSVQSVYSRSSGSGSGSTQPASYFQFPTPELVELTETTTRGEPSVHLPPPTTHYWTSDSTRRLEYAAIDAASRGVKGWIRRHLVPDCFTPRHVAFDDDSGSVRRYRLELEEDDEKVCPRDGERRKAWHLFSLRKSSTA